MGATGCQSPEGSETAQAGPISLAVSADVLDFGKSPVGRVTSKTFVVINQGTEKVVLPALQLKENTSPDFSVSSEEIAIEAGASRELTIGFNPSTLGAHAGEVILQSQDGSQVWSVLLTGLGGPCFYLSHDKLDFLEINLSCGPKSLVTRIVNHCDYPVWIKSTSISSNTSGVFTLSPEPANQYILPHAELELNVTFNPQQLAPFNSILTFNTDAPLDSAASVVSCSLTGAGSAYIEKTEDFTVELEFKSKKIDILFMIDNFEVTLPTNQIARVLTELKNEGFDFQLGFIPSLRPNLVCGADASRVGGALIPVDGSSPKILTHTTPSLLELVDHRMARGGCRDYRGYLEDGDDVGLDSISYALSPRLLGSSNDYRTVTPNDGMADFIRPEAELAVVFISYHGDEGRSHPDVHAQDILAAKAGDGSKIAAVDITVFDGFRYAGVVRTLGGLHQDIERFDSAAIKEELIKRLRAEKKELALSRKAVASSLVVTVNGMPATYTYDMASNKIVFANSLKAGDQVHVRYEVGCD